ncbi:hypothetical protein VNO80_23869 [Phaseolus coccineus]|uniref:Uncharacterized protein n=1 Tax=Phaseolus coccineus TaxID=3886 RepID=A0AAN9M786_PHACN
MPACLSRSSDARMSRALAMSACLSRPGNARVSRALAIPIGFTSLLSFLSLAAGFSLILSSSFNQWIPFISVQVSITLNNINVSASLLLSPRFNQWSTFIFVEKLNVSDSLVLKSWITTSFSHLSLHSS